MCDIIGSMLRRIRLENFMSHKDTTIELADGLTVLVGPNNCGKSAVVEALRVLCENPPSETVVRHGEKLCRITAETDDGHILVWQRKGTVVSYEIDGQAVHRLGRNTVPDDLHKHLKLPLVPIPGERWINVHFGLQKSPIFLLDRTESEIAGFFSVSSDAEKLLRMQQLHGQHTREAKSRKRELETEVSDLDQQLERLAPLQTIAPAVAQAERTYEELLAENRAMNELEQVMEGIVKMAGLRDQQLRQFSALAPLRPAPELEDEAALERLADRLGGIEKDVARESARLAALGPLSPVPELSDTAPLEVLVNSMARQQREKGQHAARLAAMESLAAPPEVEDEVGLIEVGRRLSAAIKEHDRARRQAGALAALADVPEIADALPLEQFLARWDQLDRSRVDAANEKLAADAELRESGEQLRRWAEANPQCPLCGSAISAEAVISGGHAHG